MAQIVLYVWYGVCRPRDDSSVDMSDHEEEFYYTEVEENVDAVRQTSADMQATSPTRTRLTQLSDAGALPDHDYQRKVCLCRTQLCMTVIGDVSVCLSHVLVTRQN